MKKIIIIASLFLFAFTLSGCGKKTYDVELVGETTIELIRGETYTDEGIMFEGEVSDEFTISDDINFNELGTYTVTYSHKTYGDYSRTVVVVKNGEDYLADIIDNTKDKTNFQLDEYIESEFHGPGGSGSFYFDGSTMWNGNLGTGQITTNVYGSEMTMFGWFEIKSDKLESYISMDEAVTFDMIEEDYEDDFLGLSMNLEDLDVTGFNIDGNEITIEVLFDPENIASDYETAYELLVGITSSPEASDIIPGVIKSVDGLLSYIKIDVTDEISEDVEAYIGVTIDKFIIEYSYSKIDEVPPLEAPDAVKNMQ